jgi:hypothetical protein
MRRASSLLLVATLALSACNRTSEPDPSGTRGAGSAQSLAPGSAAPAHAAAPPTPSGPTGPADVGFDAPGAWTRAEKPGRMRKATYYVPRAPGDAEEGEMSVSQAGGTVEQNIARWALQLERKLPDVKRTPRTVNGLAVTVVEIHGDYLGMSMPGSGPPVKKPGYALLGAIVETSPPTFFKVTGPEKTVMAAQRDFDKMVDSLHAK